MNESLKRFRAARDSLLQHRGDAARAHADFRWPELDTFNWALDHFDEMARDNDATALWIIGDDGREEKVGFDAMRTRSNQVANYLEGLGVQRGDRVLLMLGNEVPLWEVMLACIKIGAVMIPATHLLTRDDLQDRLTRGEVKHIVTNPTLAPKFDGLAPELTRIVAGGAVTGWHDLAESRAKSGDYVALVETRPDEPLLLYFTSGTTSLPKLVEHTHQSYPVGHLSTMYWIGLQRGDVHWNISSPGWAKHAWSCFFAPWIVGATIFVFNYVRFDARRVLQTLVDKRVTTLCAPPTVWRMLIQEKLADYRISLREVVGAGEPLNPEVIEQVRAGWNLTIRDGYGQTETTAQIGNPPGQLLKPGSMGLPLPGYPIVLLDADDRPSDEGEIAIDLSARPVALMRGYAKDEGRTADAMRGGYYRTGDVASRDADGYITYVGRADDVFKASDYRISPFELESVLIEHPAVAEAAVVPSPDPLKLAVPKAFVTLVAGQTPDAATAQSILAFCRERLAPYKRIRRLEFMELPKTISGKIRRVEMRKREEARAVPVVRGEGEYFDDQFSA
ncbi:MAG: AMP-binding protein [Proteobacteria bacterium]|nr:AMP-binding protein [Pseudomonadota bacterium]